VNFAVVLSTSFFILESWPRSQSERLRVHLVTGAGRFHKKLPDKRNRPSTRLALRLNLATWRWATGESFLSGSKDSGPLQRVTFRLR